MDSINLNGAWQCTFPDGTRAAVVVPGCFDTAAERWDIGGPVLYERTFPYAGEGAARLVFDGVSYHCEAALNGHPLGSHEGIWDGFDLDATGALVRGENRLTLRVTKPGYDPKDPYPLRQVLSGFIPDVLCAFGGVWDDVRLESAPSFFVLGHSASGGCDGAGSARCRVRLVKPGAMEATLRVLDSGNREVCRLDTSRDLPAGESEWTLPFQVDAPEWWSTQTPHLYRYELTLCCGGQAETVSRRFGFREIAADGNRLLLNGRPVYLRGILHWGYYEQAMVPNPTEAEIRDELEKIRAFGFNAVKHCLYIPRQRYFDLMDEYGLLGWVEMPLWLPEEKGLLTGRIRREYPRIFEQLRGHPCLSLVSLGCELDATVDGSILEEMYHLAKRDLGALVRDNSGSGECYGGLAVDYADFSDYHFYAELPNLEHLIETFTPGWRTRRPWLFGEFCDSDTLRDLSLVRREKGVRRLKWESGDARKNPISSLKPDFFAHHHDERMEASGIRAAFPLLSQLSLNHSLVHRKTTLEMTRSFGAVCGYNITNLRDVPIATSGLLNDLGRPKVDPAVIRRFNQDLVLVPAWDLGRVWIGADRVQNRERYNFRGGDAYSLHVLLSNYGEKDIEGAALRYRLLSEGEAVRSGEIPCARLKQGEVSEAAYVRFDLPPADAPACLRLQVSLNADGCLCENEFPIFLYPRAAFPERIAVYDPCGGLPGIGECFQALRLSEGDEIPGDCAALVCTLFSDRVQRYLEDGGRVVLVQNGDGALPVVHAPMWREGMFRAFDHPIFKEIPQGYEQDDLRYFSMTTDVAFDPMPGKDVTPVLRRYDCRQWTVSDYLTTFRMGRGLCAATTLRLGGGMGRAASGVSRNPFAVYLLREMLRATGV